VQAGRRPVGGHLPDGRPTRNRRGPVLRCAATGTDAPVAATGSKGVRARRGKRLRRTPLRFSVLPWPPTGSADGFGRGYALPAPSGAGLTPVVRWVPGSRPRMVVTRRHPARLPRGGGGDDRPDADTVEALCVRDNRLGSDSARIVALYQVASGLRRVSESRAGSPSPGLFRHRSLPRASGDDTDLINASRQPPTAHDRGRHQPGRGQQPGRGR
jgi:hypothetical protein